MKDSELNSHSSSRPHLQGEFFRSVADTAIDGIVITDQNSIIVYCNKAAGEIFQYRQEDLIGKGLDMLMPEKYREGHRRGVNRFVTTGVPKIIGKTVQVEGLKNSGEAFPMNLSLSFWKQQGDFFFTGIIRDITEQVKAESRYRLLAENSSDIISRHTPESIYLYVSPSCEQVLGYKPDELIGKNPYSYIHPEDIAGLQAEHKKVLQNPVISTIEVRFLCKDGHYKWLEVTGKNIKDPQTEEVIEIQTSARDISHRKEQEIQLQLAYEELQATLEELHASNEELQSTQDELMTVNVNLEEKIERRATEISAQERLFRFIVESVKDYAIFMLSPKGCISSWNTGAMNVYGYSNDEIEGKHFSLFYSDDLKDHYPAYELREALKTGRFEDEGWRIKKDGSSVWANDIVTPVFNEAKVHIGFAKVTRDLTERKKTEESLRRTNNDLDNFIYTASHDLKAPVNNLEGLFAAVSDTISSECSDSINEAFAMMMSSVDRLKLVIYELSEISKLQKSLNQEYENIDLISLLEDFKASYSNEIDNTHATIRSKFSASTVYFPRKNLRTIFHNFLSNAIKYRNPVRNPEISIESYQEDQFIVLVFSDNGLGFDISRVDKVFEMFKRLHDHVEGTGVGLYIVKRIIDNAGGKIEVESQEGRGTTFKIYLPVEPLN